jgi:hypothetical protein
MTHSEGIQRLQSISGDAVRLLRHLEDQSCTAPQEIEVRQLAAALKKSLQEEYDRIMPERSQKNMTLFELTVYSPTIKEVWKETGISRLKIEGPSASEGKRSLSRSPTRHRNTSLEEI